MKVIELLSADCMIMELQGTTKSDVIKEMVEKLYGAGRINNQETFEAGIIAREKQTSTGLGDGIAMPHSKNAAVVKPTVLFAKSSQGVDYESLDGQPTFLFFMIAAPEGANDTHLEALAGLSRLLLNPALIGQLKEADSAETVINLFDKAQQTYDAEQLKDAANVDDSSRPFVVAVTACPTGIAHTYMAEDALKNKAKEMNVSIKVETNGSEGVKHRLSKEDIEKASGVIIAADKNVEMARFDGKHLVNRPVSDGIKKSEELINLAMSDSAPVYHHDGSKDSAEEESSSGSVGSQIYKHLMNGISHMLPFVIGGGIIIALSFMVDQFMGVPQDSLHKLGSYHQLAAQLNTIGGAAFGFMLPVLAGFIASSISDRPGLVAGFAAGALANTGGAGFLGALLGGFIAGYVIEFLRKILKGLPKSLDGIKAILFYPLLGVLITGAIMLVINVPMAAINTGLNSFLNGLSGGNAALLGALLGGMMAVDLGGPINKAAYVFGTGTLAATVATGGSPMMAAVMAGGMVPPLAIAIATLLFKDKFSKKDKDAGLTNLVMGFSFITEGAIPFAASDPLKMIPSFMVGSALAGGLVGGAGIKLMAPHGGIFVIMLVNKPILYLVFILIGSLVSALVLGLLKKKVVE
ncbi:PTS fructose transporter subunit IIABC [Vagococcus sp.]|uniref:PTS fructose transporter subunit IIABC n=1 Tax=Vagococcus sp. TaxID=1933889 RepID=UPI002FCA5055